jgi:hypothetical protein
MAFIHQDGRRVPMRHLVTLAIAATSLCVGVAYATSAMAVTFNPALVISDDNMRAYDSMSQSDIQAFLDTQKGPLKSLVTTEHAGGKDNLNPSKVTKKASQIIWEACQAWHINPRTMLTLLQKEQSLLTRTSLDKNTLSRAIGAGCPGGPTNRYPGFGSQMWFGARLLDGYGEGKNGSTIPLWKSPYTTVKDIYQDPNVSVKTANVSTYKLYIYNPSIGAKTPYGDLSSQSSHLSGNANFWMIYRKHFGDTFANPAVRPIYRLRNRKNGNYFYTKSQTERYQFVKSGRWKYERVGFSWDTSATANNVPVYRFLNRKTREYLFTASPKMVRWLKGPVKSPLWRCDGVAFKGSMSATSAAAVCQFTNKRTGRYFLTTSTAEKASMLSTTNRRKWSYAGIVFYMKHR